jgi:hypothetical protein
MNEYQFGGPMIWPTGSAEPRVSFLIMHHFWQVDAVSERWQGFNIIGNCHCLRQPCTERRHRCARRSNPMAVEEIALGWKKHPALAMTIHVDLSSYNVKTLAGNRCLSLSAPRYGWCFPKSPIACSDCLYVFPKRIVGFHRLRDRCSNVYHVRF